MNNNLYNRFSKIGYGCYSMNISTILEYKNSLHLALNYVSLDFFYNKNMFSDYKNFNFEHVETVALGYEANHKTDYFNYKNDILKKLNIYDIEVLNFNDIILYFKSNSEPLICPCDPFYLYDYYKKINIDFKKRHSRKHSVVVTSIQNGVVEIIDKSFEFIGKVDINDFMLSANSIHNEYDNLYKININNFLSSSEYHIISLIKKNIINDNCIDLNINEVKYMNGIQAIQNFINDFDFICKEIFTINKENSLKILFTSIYPFFLQRIGAYYLIRSLNKDNDILNLGKFEDKLFENALIWKKLESVLIKGIIAKKNIYEYMNKLEKIFLEIIKSEKNLLIYIGGL